MEKQRLYLDCNKELLGRADKKFCDSYCKSSYHYKLRQTDMSFYEEVDQQLKLNRRILKLFNKAGKATVRGEVLLEQGFNPDFWINLKSWGGNKVKGDICRKNISIGQKLP